jgi:hypothetical protein
MSTSSDSRKKVGYDIPACFQGKLKPQLKRSDDFTMVEQRMQYIVAYDVNNLKALGLDEKNTEDFRVVTVENKKAPYLFYVLEGLRDDIKRELSSDLIVQFDTFLDEKILRNSAMIRLSSELEMRLISSLIRIGERYRLTPGAINLEVEFECIKDYRDKFVDRSDVKQYVHIKFMVDYVQCKLSRSIPM